MVQLNRNTDKNTEKKTEILDTRNEIKNMQKLNDYMNCLPSSLLLGASLQLIFIWLKFEKDTYSQCLCLLNNWCQKWRNFFYLSHFECKNHAMTPQGLIVHLYATAFGKKGCEHHMATYYYLY